jgi:murein DD-endopeptidase MepM/ murein hydrolase activator NlpD
LAEINKEKNINKQRELVNDLWNKTTTGILEAQKFKNKYGHTKNWSDIMHFKESTKIKSTVSTSVPYYNQYPEGYDKYILANKAELDSLYDYYKKRVDILNSTKKELEKYIPDDEMVHFGKVLSPVPKDFNYHAAAGSRFIPDTKPAYVWRVHQGLDFANGRGGTTVRATLDGVVTFKRGDFGIKHEYEENGKKQALIAVYRHMPKQSYEHLKVGEQVSVGKPIGVVGKEGTRAYHLHYEVWRREEIEVIDSKGNKKVDYKYTALDPTLGFLPGDKR